MDVTKTVRAHLGLPAGGVATVGRKITDSSAQKLNGNSPGITPLFEDSLACLTAGAAAGESEPTNSQPASNRASRKERVNE
jgi:hypothetical protein